MSEGFEKIIRETESTCPECHKGIKALVVEREGKVFMDKECPEHGRFDLKISEHPWYYAGLNEYYFKVMPGSMEQRRYYLYLSNRCNLNCPICLLEPNQNKKPDITLARFKELIEKNKRSRFYLYGAEPTLLEDIEEWIRLLKSRGNVVNMHTNGIKLADEGYVEKLKNCGLDYVSLQFDGFDDKIYNTLRGRSLLDIKLKALDNLGKFNISTGLNVTVVKGINDDQIGDIIDYAVRRSFIKDVSFATLSFLGNTNDNFSPDPFLMPDALIDLTENQTGGKISRKSVFLFQKLYYAILSIFKIRRCYNFHHIALVRTPDNGYYTFDKLFKLDRFEKKLDKYKRLVQKDRKLAAVYFFAQFFLNFLKSDLFEKLRCVPLNIIIPGKIISPRIPSRVLLVSFGTVCDFYKYDAQIAQYCGQGFCLSEGGDMVLTDSISDVTLFNKNGATCK